MSKIKSLILGSAAGFVAIAGAQAADLPVKAKAVQYVKICSLYGAGFYYIPGTETCIKLGGYVQVDASFNGGNYNLPSWSTDPGLPAAGTSSAAYGTQSRNSDVFTTRARANFNLDTRTATEYGVVRTYWSSNFEHSSNWGPSSGNLTVDYAFIQFAGFTFGKAVSSFQTPWGAYGANNNTSFLLGGYDNATGINQVAYTWQFGNGVSAQIGVEDNRTINRAQLINASWALTDANVMSGTYANQYAANGAPDITGNIKIDQAAFTAQLSAGAHQIRGMYYGTSAATMSEVNGNPSDTWGFAVQGGLQLKNLPTGPGDKLSLDAIYANGAMKYIISGVTGTAFSHYSGSSIAYNSFAAMSLADGVFVNLGSIERTTGWGFRGTYVHNWTPNWESSVFGSYTKIDYNTNATNALCSMAAPAGASFAGRTACNPDFAIWQIGTRTAWTPVQNLTFSAEALYSYLDQNNAGTYTSGAAYGYKPAGAVYEYKDQGIWSGNLRVRRTF